MAVMYKGFDLDLTCRNKFQYKIGEKYSEPRAIPCRAGFHACVDPINVLRYCLPNRSRYCLVDLDGVFAQCGDGIRSPETKACGTDIRIIKELDIRELAAAHQEYIKKRSEEAGLCTEAAADGAAVSAGLSGYACAGDNSAVSAQKGAVCAGKRSAAVVKGNGSAVTGDFGSSVSGTCGISVTGNRGTAVSGDGGAAVTGYCGAAVAGSDGMANAGNVSVALTASYGFSSAGDFGVAASGSEGIAVTNHGGTSIAKDKGKAVSGAMGKSFAGDLGVAAAGPSGTAVSRGMSFAGEGGVAVARGHEKAAAAGGLGAVLVLIKENAPDCDAEDAGRSYCGSIKRHRTIVVDGKEYLPGTWYELNDNGDIVITDGPDCTAMEPSDLMLDPVQRLQLLQYAVCAK